MTNNTNNPNTNEPLFITVAEDPDDIPNKSDINNNDLKEFTSRSPNNYNNNGNNNSILTQRNAHGPRKHAHHHRNNIKPSNTNSQFDPNSRSQNEYDPQYDVSYPDGRNSYNRALSNNHPNYNQNFPSDHRHEYQPHKHSHHNHHNHPNHNNRPNYNYNRTKQSAPLRYDSYSNSPNEFFDPINENFYNQRHPIQPIPTIQPMIQPIQTIQPIQHMPIMMPVPISSMPPVHTIPQVPQMPIVYQPLQLHTPISVQATPLPTLSSQLPQAQPVIIQPQVTNQKLPAIRNNRNNRRLNESSRSVTPTPPPPPIEKDSPRFVYNIHHYPPATKSTKPKVIETNYNIIKKKPKKNLVF